MLYRRAYKGDMTGEEEDLLRRLRHRGFAVAVLPPVEVGNQLNRSPIEQSMVRAARQFLNQKEVRTHGRTG
jgi:hypothetical protein